MEIREVNDQGDWNNWLLAQQPNTFLQSWEWGEVQKRSGEGVRYLVFEDNGKRIGQALLVTVNAKRGKFLFVPHGPVIAPPYEGGDRGGLLKQFVAYCHSLAKQDGAVALRIAPLLETNEANQNLFCSLDFRPAPMHMHSELTWMLDISPSEEQLIAGMRKTTRHAIKKAQAAGVTVDIDSTGAAVERFLPLYQQTEQRHGFIRFSDQVIRDQVEIFGREGKMFMAIAKHDGQDVAGAIFIQFGSTVFYHHGASLKLPSNIPAAQLLQWEAVREARRRRATHYNFWGIAPEGKPNHPFAGITTFKKGFGGYAIDYLHARDFPLSRLYWKLWAVDTYRKWKRGF